MRFRSGCEERKNDLLKALENTGNKIIELRKKAKEIGEDPEYRLGTLANLEVKDIPLTSHSVRAYRYLYNKYSEELRYNYSSLNKFSDYIKIDKINDIGKIVIYYHKFTGAESCDTLKDDQIDALLTVKDQLSNWSYPLIDHRLSDHWGVDSFSNKKKYILTPSRISAAEYLGKCNIFPNDNYLPYVDATVYALLKMKEPSQSEVKAVKHFWSSSFKIEQPEPDQIKHLALIFDEGEKEPTVPQYNAVLYMKTHFPKEKIDLRKINLVAYVMGVGISQPSTQDMQAARCLIEHLKIDKPSDKLIIWTKEFREKFKKDPIKGQIPLKF